MQIDLSPELADILTGLKASVDDLREKLSVVHSALPSPTSPTVEVREWYSVDDAAALLGKRPYTVREWCRHGQINAGKRAERRGGAALWMISAKEVARYRNEGLLEINPERNNVN